MKNQVKFIIMGCVMFLSIQVLAEVQKDAKLRDENISDTNLSVDVTKVDGLYKYEYSLDSPSSNLGIISGIKIDISCDLDFGEVNIPVTEERLDYLGNRSNDGKHVPIEVFAGYGMGSAYGVSRLNTATWGVYLKPGNAVSKLVLLSPAPPGDRHYQIKPSMDNDPSWNYDQYDENDPSVPWIEDFTLSGMITGPACSLGTPPDDQLYLGTGVEPFQINSLLRYSQPTSNPVNITDPSDLLTLTVHYHKGINPQQFTARLNGEDVSSLFNPLPNTHETVQLPGPWVNYNKLKLSVVGVVDGRVKGQSLEKRPAKSYDNPSQEKAALKFDQIKSKDVDTFYVHVVK